MISYELFTRLRHLVDQAHWKLQAVARELGLNIKTVRLWAKRVRYERKRREPRSSKLDPFKNDLVRLLAEHPYSSAQLLLRLREAGYTGGVSILRAYVAQVRPRKSPAYLTLTFQPGECVQVDWGYAGVVPVGQTRRRLSFFVMVLGYSRKLYVEFTLSETLEQFLACHQNAFAYFGGVPRKVMLDNLKTAVLSHPAGQPVIFHPRYLDFARFYGFEPRACNVRAAHEKGIVERAIGYLRTSFLNGLPLESFAPLNPSVRLWMDQVANERIHGETRKKPNELFAEEQARLERFPPSLYDVAQIRAVHATRRFRVRFDSNRYSVPAEYAGARLVLHAYPDKLCIFHHERLIAEHVRSYDRAQDIENPDHVRALLEQRHRARDQKLLQRFLQLSPLAETYYQELGQRRFNPAQHVAKIVALSEIYGVDATRSALADACEFQAFSSEYIANLLEQRQRLLPEPGALHLTRRQDLLDLELPEANLAVYETSTPPKESNHV
jgi:transposase